MLKLRLPAMSAAATAPAARLLATTSLSRAVWGTARSRVVSGALETGVRSRTMRIRPLTTRARPALARRLRASPVGGCASALLLMGGYVATGGVGGGQVARACYTGREEDCATTWARIEEAIAKGEPVLLSKTSCGYCVRVKRVLDSLGVRKKVKVFELDYCSPEDSGEVQKETHHRYGIFTVPQFYLGGEFVGDSQQVTSLYQDGSLEKRLRDAGLLDEPAE